MKPRLPRRLRAGLRFVGVAALGILYGSAYGAVGVYISLFIDGLGGAEHWQTMALCIWDRCCLVPRRRHIRVISQKT
jgi:hypothetical protein